MMLFIFFQRAIRFAGTKLIDPPFRVTCFHPPAQTVFPSAGDRLRFRNQATANRFYLPCCLLIAFTIRSVRRSARALLREITAQAAAGIHPMSVHCRMRQSIPVSMRPRNMNESQGNMMARRVMQRLVKANKLA